MRIFNRSHLIYGVRMHQTGGQCDCGDCDCACAEVLDSSFDTGNISAQLRTTPVAAEFQLSGNFEVRNGIYHRPIVIDQITEQLLTTFSKPRVLTESEQIQSTNSLTQQMIKLGVLSPIGHTINFDREHTLLTAWLQTTNKCNFACRYCYSPRQKADMSLQIGYDVINTVFKAASAYSYPIIKLKYAGGEPLLRFTLIEQLHRRARELSNRQGIDLEGVILSNGTLLTPQILETMQSLGLRLMISLDGLGAAHDSQRPYANGDASSMDVVEAIDLAIAFGLTPDISITVSSRNVESLPELVEWLLERDLPFSFNFYRENKYSVSYDDLRLEEEKIIRGLLAAYKVIEANLPKRSLLSSIVNRANLAIPHLRPCSVGNSYMVFDTQGNISKCQTQLDSPVTTIKEQDPLAVLQRDTTTVQNLSVEEKDECKTCDWRYWCAGGCPVEAYRVTGKYNAKSPNCAIYKALFPEVVRLEGLRLLKYAQNS